MNLTGKELVAKEIITGLLDEHGNLKQEYTDNVQQHGVDLNVIKIERIVGIGYIPTEGKTKLAERTIVLPMLNGDDVKVWTLEPGSYEVTFKQGCKIPSDQRMRILHRSSMVRNAGTLISGWFDAGFQTHNMGAVLHLHQPMMIGVGARIAQATTDVSNIVENLYEGQWQGDKQRDDSFFKEVRDDLHRA